MTIFFFFFFFFSLRFSVIRAAHLLFCSRWHPSCPMYLLHLWNPRLPTPSTPPSLPISTPPTPLRHNYVLYVHAVCACLFWFKVELAACITGDFDANSPWQWTQGLSGSVTDSLRQSLTPLGLISRLGRSYTSSLRGSRDPIGCDGGRRRFVVCAFAS